MWRSRQDHPAAAMIDPDQGLLSAAPVLRVQNLEAGRVNANRVAAVVKENVEVGARYGFYLRESETHSLRLGTYLIIFKNTIMVFNSSLLRF